MHGPLEKDMPAHKIRVTSDRKLLDPPHTILAHVIRTVARVLSQNQHKIENRMLEHMLLGPALPASHGLLDRYARQSIVRGSAQVISCFEAMALIFSEVSAVLQLKLLHIHEPSHHTKNEPSKVLSFDLGLHLI